MAQRRTLPLPWFQRFLLRSISTGCVLAVLWILSPHFSFENGVDVQFHFSNVLTFILAMLFFPALLGLSWIFDSFAGARIDAEREEQNKATITAMKSDPRKE